MRAFEMPPHARMSLTQQLLLRSLIAKFWSQPYEPARLARWGTELHDRFGLPYFIEQDLHDVLAELRADGYPCSRSGSRRTSSFVSPSMVISATRAVDVEIRQALEAVACHGRGGNDRRHGSLCGFVGRAGAGEGHGPGAGPLCDRMQWPCSAVAPNWCSR